MINRILARYNILASGDLSGSFDGTNPSSVGSGTSDWDASDPVGYKDARAEVGILSEEDYHFSLSDYDEEYEGYAGSDLATLFYPYQMGPTSQDYVVSMPAVSGISQDGEVTSLSLLPFFFDASQGRVNKNSDADHCDSVADIVTGSVYPIRTREIRDLGSYRGVGLRLPIMAVGWGYDLEGNPTPSGADGTFAGDVPSGCLMDPKDYIAAPIDLRYDRSRDVWTAAGDTAGFWGRIKSSSPITDAFNRWEYTVTKVIPEQEGRWKDAVPVEEEQTDFVVYNTVEANNAETGVQGNGTDVSNLPPGFSLQPIGAGAVVRVWNTIDCEGQIMYVFEGYNTIDGDCDT